jgi:hypothetical protein
MREARQTRERVGREMALEYLKAHPQQVFDREEVVQVLTDVCETRSKANAAGFVAGVFFAAVLFALVFWVSR